MRFFHITYKNGHQERFEALDKEQLIDEYFNGDQDSLKEKVETISWKENTMQCMEIVETGEVQHKVIGPDTNPYGWRNEAE